MSRLNGYELQLLKYLQAHPESIIIKTKGSKYFYTYIKNTTENITMAMLNKFEKYGLVEASGGGFSSTTYRISEKGREF